MWSVFHVEAVECMSSAGSVCMLECELCCELLLLLSLTDIGCLVLN